MGESEAEKRIALLSEQLALAKHETAETLHEIARIRAQLEDSQRNEGIYALRVADVTRQLQQIESSTIWRTTGVIRQLGSRFPFFFRGLRRLLKLLWWTVTLQIVARYREHRQGHVAFRNRQPVVEKPTPAAAQLVIPVSEEPVVSFIIPTYGQLRFTLLCLQSIMEHPPACAFEVVVIDDAYEGTEDVAQLSQVRGINFVRNESNLGFLFTCNHAATLCKGRYLYFLNNDTEICPGAVDALVEVLESRPDAGMVGSKLIYPDGALQEAGGILWSDASGWNFGRDGDPARPEFNYLRQVDYCSGASVMIARALFESFGGFNPDLAPAYYEDADLALRIQQRGMKVLYEPRSVVIHHEGKSHGTDLTSGVKAHQVVNRSYMSEHWGPVLLRDHFPGPRDLMRARDHGRNRQTIVIIDQYVPEPDRDAGSRSVLGIIKSLVEADWIVKFWPHNRLHSPVYTTALERLGVEVIDQRWPGDFTLWLRQNGAWLDHILIARPNVAVEVLSRIPLDTKSVVSFYGVDLHFERLRRQAEFAGPAEAAKILAEAQRSETIERKVWGRVDLVFYPSETEAAVVRQMAPRVLSRSIVPFTFPVSPPRDQPPALQSILFVGGFGHPPNVDAAKFLIFDILPLLERKIGPVRVVLAGSHPTAAVLALAGPNIAVTGYVSDDELARLYQTHRIAVIPLRFGAGVKGKVVEALSRGLPLVTTSTGAQGISGLEDVVPVHDDVFAIVQAMAKLITDDDVWLAQSQAQLNFANSRFSFAAMQASVIGVLEEGKQSAG